jgi:hypothetical protein
MMYVGHDFDRSFPTCVGKYAHINGSKIKILDALSAGPNCVPYTLLLQGGRSVTYHEGVGWVMQDHGQGEWIPELSIYGIRVKAPCYPSSTPGKIAECLEITSE